jgi:hypothetical protein
MLNELLGWQIAGRIKTILSLHSAVVLYGFSYSQSQAFARLRRKALVHPRCPAHGFTLSALGINCTPFPPQGTATNCFPKSPGVRLSEDLIMLKSVR